MEFRWLLVVVPVLPFADDNEIPIFWDWRGVNQMGDARDRDTSPTTHMCISASFTKLNLA